MVRVIRWMVGRLEAILCLDNVPDLARSVTLHSTLSVKAPLVVTWWWIVIM